MQNQVHEKNLKILLTNEITLLIDFLKKVPGWFFEEFSVENQLFPLNFIKSFSMKILKGTYEFVGTLVYFGVKTSGFSWFYYVVNVDEEKQFFIFFVVFFRFLWHFSVKTCLHLNKKLFFVLKKIVISDSMTTSNNHGFMNFGDRHKCLDETTQNDPKFLNFQKQIKFVYFPPFYDTQNKNCSFLVDNVQNEKFLWNNLWYDSKKYMEQKLETISTAHNYGHKIWLTFISGYWIFSIYFVDGFVFFQDWKQTTHLQKK